MKKINSIIVSVVMLMALVGCSQETVEVTTTTKPSTTVAATTTTTTFVMPAGNVTAEATYKNIPVVTYTVSFDANGGTGSMADATGVSGDYVLPVCGFTAPNGKHFKAWSVGGVEKAAGDTITVNANTTVTAIWENIPVTYYTVTFDSNGGSAVTAQSIEAGQKATKPADPTKDGYDFKGWTLNGSAYDFNTAVNGNITLVATWEQKQVVPTTYTVSFAANGGTGTMADVTGISGEYTLPENSFTAPDGKQFKAWSVDGNEKAVGDKITVTADTTVTAVWETIPAGHTCDIEKDRRPVPDDILEKLPALLHLTEAETEEMYDLAARSRNTVSADLPEYIMEKDIVRAALRTAKKHNVTDKQWEDFIRRITKESD